MTVDVAPEKAKICEKVVAHATMRSTAPLITAAPSSACLKFFNVSDRYMAQIPIVAAAPSAADSVGVAKPATIPPTTTTKITINGNTFTKKGLPQDLNELETSITRGSDEPFMVAEDDPWGVPYYINPLSRRQFQICSAGPDAEEGTDDDICYPEERDR